MLTVNELASRSGVPAHVVRYYLRIDLIQPAEQQDNGYRLFDTEDIAKLRFIRMAKYLGYTLNEIRSILQHAEEGESPCPEVRGIIRQRIRENREKIREMTRLQTRMERALKMWDDMPDGAPDGTHVCHLIESIGEDH